MLKHWIDNNPKDASWKTLIEALASRSLDQRCLAEDIQKKLLSGKSSQFLIKDSLLLSLLLCVLL